MKFGKLVAFLVSLAILIAVVVYFAGQKQEGVQAPPQLGQIIDNTINEPTPDKVASNSENLENEPSDSVSETAEPTAPEASEVPVEPTDEPQQLEPDTDAESIGVIVNPNYKLPDNYEPKDLVYPDVRFTFKEKIEKRMMRKEAAGALETMFEAAEVDGIYLAGVSAYRSHSTQTALFNRYVERDGLEKAKTYSAEPGTSEHETGLAIDVSGSDGKCAAQDCFADTVEAVWLENNAAKYGFIIRYPEGKQDITGYKYEPWHLRYVGVDIAEQIAAQGLTLEEYYGVEPVKR